MSDQLRSRSEDDVVRLAARRLRPASRGFSSSADGAASTSAFGAVSSGTLSCSAPKADISRRAGAWSCSPPASSAIFRARPAAAAASRFAPQVAGQNQWSWPEFLPFRCFFRANHRSGRPWRAVILALPYILAPSGSPAHCPVPAGIPCGPRHGCSAIDGSAARARASEGCAQLSPRLQPAHLYPQGC